MKIKYRLLPVEPYEISALETWLSDLSAQGLHLLEIKKLYASFWVKEPKRMLYRMEPKKYRKEEYPAQDKLRFYEEYGWKYVDTFGEYFHIYSAEEGTPEIHTDPIVESELYRVFLPKRNYDPYIEMAFWVLFLFLYFVNTALRLRSENAYQLVHGYNSMVLWYPLFVSMPILSSLRKAAGIKRVRDMLASGTPLSHDANWQGRLRRKRWLTYFCGIIAAVCFFLMFFPGFLDYAERPMAEIKHPLPFVALAEIENDPDFVPSKSYIQHSRLQTGEYIDSWERDAETVYFHSSIGAPVQFSINQHGTIRDKTNEKGTPYQATLWLRYKKFSFLVSPQEYLEESLAHDDRTPDNGWTKTPLTDTPFDSAVLLQKGSDTELYMILGDKMLEADYTGRQDLTQCYDLFLEVLQKEYHR